MFPQMMQRIKNVGNLVVEKTHRQSGKEKNKIRVNTAVIPPITTMCGDNRKQKNVRLSCSFAVVESFFAVEE
jgi:hypothetical protein